MIGDNSCCRKEPARGEGAVARQQLVNVMSRSEAKGVEKNPAPFQLFFCNSPQAMLPFEKWLRAPPLQSTFVAIRCKEILAR